MSSLNMQSENVTEERKKLNIAYQYKTEEAYNWAPFLRPGDTSSPLYTRGTSTFNKASDGALMKVTLSIASVATCM